MEDTIPGAFYIWETIDGHIVGDSIGIAIQIDEPGTYIVEGSLVNGCQGQKDTIVVTVDQDPPIVSINIEEINGCEVAVHLLGGANGYTYSWVGPNNFTSNNQDVDATTEGLYILEVSNLGNGCIARDSVYVLDYPCQELSPGTVPTGITTVSNIDDIPPTFNLPPDIILDCNVDATNLSLTGDATNEADNCDPNIGEATYADEILSNYPCEGNTLIVRTWSLTDACNLSLIHI